MGMKTRQGFVSNSSTSSFLIYGMNVEGDSEDVESKIDELKLDLGYWYVEGGGLYVGRSWSGVKDDQTGLQFKESVTEDVKKLLAGVGSEEKVDCGTHQEAWYN